MYCVAKPWMNEKVFQYCEWNCDAMYDKCTLELFVKHDTKSFPMYEWFKMNGYEWWKMMNVTDVHACYELQYEKENKAQRNDKCEKCKCVVALRYMWQKKCEKKCDEEQKWQMWIVQVWYGTKIYVTKRNVKKEMWWKTEMTSVKSASVLWHQDMCEKWNVEKKCAEKQKWQMWKVQVCCGTNIYVTEKLKNRKLKSMEEWTRTEMSFAKMCQ